MKHLRPYNEGITDKMVSVTKSDLKDKIDMKGVSFRGISANEFKSKGGSSSQHAIRTTYDKLVELFGKPSTSAWTWKVIYEWYITDDNGNYFTIYDWKQSENGQNEETLKVGQHFWNIGGVNEEVSRDLKKYILFNSLNEGLRDAMKPKSKEELLSTIKGDPNAPFTRTKYPGSGQLIGEFPFTYDNLVKLFGRPEYNKEAGDYGEGYYIWGLKTTSGRTMYIYDRGTEGQEIEIGQDDSGYKWHIGGRDWEDADNLIAYYIKNTMDDMKESLGRIYNYDEFVNEEFIGGMLKKLLGGLIQDVKDDLKKPFEDFTKKIGNQKDPKKIISIVNDFLILHRNGLETSLEEAKTLPSLSKAISDNLTTAYGSITATIKNFGNSSFTFDNIFEDVPEKTKALFLKNAKNFNNKVKPFSNDLVLSFGKPYKVTKEMIEQSEKDAQEGSIEDAAGDTQKEGISEEDLTKLKGDIKLWFDKTIYKNTKNTLEETKKDVKKPKTAGIQDDIKKIPDNVTKNKDSVKTIIKKITDSDKQTLKKTRKLLGIDKTSAPL